MVFEECPLAVGSLLAHIFYCLLSIVYFHCSIYEYICLSYIVFLCVRLLFFFFFIFFILQLFLCLYPSICLLNYLFCVTVIHLLCCFMLCAFVTYSIKLLLLLLLLAKRLDAFDTCCLQEILLIPYTRHITNDTSPPAHQCRAGSSHSGWVSSGTLLLPLPKRTITVSLPLHLDYLLIGRGM